MTLKSAATVVHYMFECNFTMGKVEWVEIIKISIISQSSLMTLTRLILVGLLFLSILLKFQ